MVGEMSFSARAVRFFFMYLGPLVTIVVYFALFGAAGDSMSGLRAALFVALGMQSAFRIDGDPELLAAFRTWFSRGR